MDQSHMCSESVLPAKSLPAREALELTRRYMHRLNTVAIAMLSERTHQSICSQSNRIEMAWLT